MILFEKEQPFDNRIVPLPCFVITKQEYEEALKDINIRRKQREDVLNYLETQFLLEKIWIFEEDGGLYSSCNRRELHQKQHREFCESLTVIYQVPETDTDDIEKYNYYQIDIKTDDPIPENGFTLYRNGFQMEENIVSFEHAIELAFTNALDSLKKLKQILEERLKDTGNLLMLLEEQGLNSDKSKIPFSFIDETNKNN